MFFQVTYKWNIDGALDDNFLLEEVSAEKAEWFAKHKVDGSYDDTNLSFVSIKRISRAKAQQLADSNCINWAYSVD